jgi:hypothetical protein
VKEHGRFAKRERRGKARKKPHGIRVRKRDAGALGRRERMCRARGKPPHLISGYARLGKNEVFPVS